MSDASSTAAHPSAPAHGDGHGPAHHDHTKMYIKVWAILLVLLIVSVLGPEIGNLYVTLFTAFGIAIVKAFLVIRNFMHLNLEKKWVGYLLATMLLIVVVFVGGVGPDVKEHDGHHWENVAAKEEVKRGMAIKEQHQKEGGGHGGAAPHGEEAPKAH